MSLLTGVIAANLSLDRKKELFRKYEFEELCMAKYKDAAASVIQTVYRRLLYKKSCKQNNVEMNPRKIQLFYSHLQQLVRKFRQNYKRVQNSRRSHTVDERLQMLEGRLTVLEDNVALLFAESKERSQQVKEIQEKATEMLQLMTE
eukprot:TRINITY_DN1245_c0_g1_i10.p1 TRINITY_DN1245_c0_g1~~TRINITY_DN1245_c0_g1_i10.p1  ORF type:complete len:146 (-),score=49.62 TRINITY_DN1245_c0_g1_i10:3-440(-)